MINDKTQRFVKRLAIAMIVITLLIIISSLFNGCARPEDLPEGTMTAVIQLPNGEVIEGEVDDYMRWSNGWMEVTIEGITYNVNEYNVVIIQK